MKALVISAVGLGSLVALGYSRPARAEHQVVLESFVGMGAERLRSQAVVALLRLGERLIPDKEVASMSAELGLSQPSDNYPALARQLGATLFVGGSIIAKNRRLFTAWLKVKDATGIVIARATWDDASVPALLNKTQRALFPALKAMVRKAPAGGPATVSAGAADPPASEATAPVAAARRDTRNPPDRIPLPAPVEKIVDSGEPMPLGAASADEESADQLSVGAEQRRRSQSNRYDLSVGAQVYARVFTYNGIGPQQNYQVVGVPAPNLAFDYFLWPFLGVSVGGEYSVPLASRDDAGRSYRTGSFGYWAGGKLRLMSSDVELTAGAAYGENSFSFSKASGTVDEPQVADVFYRQIKAGASTRIPLTPTIAVIAGGNYLHLLAVGELQNFFPSITGFGAEAHAGATFQIRSLFEVRATANLRRYQFALKTLQADPRQADGAVDQYMGVNLSVAIRD
jgi:hypothetical protein